MVHILNLGLSPIQHTLYLASVQLSYQYGNTCSVIGYYGHSVKLVTLVNCHFIPENNNVLSLNGNRGISSKQGGCVLINS